MLQTTFPSSKEPEATFDFIASADAMELFRGSRLVPGIRRATPMRNQEILVEDQFGFRHREKVVQQKRGERLVFDIRPNRLLGLLVKGISEEWVIEERSEGSQVTRTFSLIPRAWSGALLPLFYKILQRAIEENNQTLRLHLSIGNYEIKKPLPLHESNLAPS